MENTLKSVSNDLHRVAMSLRPASLDHLGLVAAIRQHVNTILQRHTITIKVIDKSMNKRFPKNVETMVFRTVQEALTNVIRHAHATHADITLTTFDNKLVVTVEDNGIGFDPRVTQNPMHLGLWGMQERVQMVNGKLSIESAHNKGTKVIVEVDYGNSGTYR
jgi:signal transduction histidine kinase